MKTDLFIKNYREAFGETTVSHDEEKLFIQYACLKKNQGEDKPMKQIKKKVSTSKVSSQ